MKEKDETGVDLTEDKLLKGEPDQQTRPGADAREGRVWYVFKRLPNDVAMTHVIFSIDVDSLQVSPTQPRGLHQLRPCMLYG